LAHDDPIACPVRDLCRYWRINFTRLIDVTSGHRCWQGSHVWAGERINWELSHWGDVCDVCFAKFVQEEATD